MFTYLCISQIVTLSYMTQVLRAERVAADSNVTTCEEFERGAYFNPYLLIDSMWKIFYFWSNTSEIYPIIFSLPAKNRLQRFLDEIDAIDPYMKVDWNKATLFMSPRDGTEVLFLYQGSPGAFRAVIKQEQRNKVRPHPPPLIKLADVRMKMIDHILGMMSCEEHSAYALAKIEHMPDSEEMCSLHAARIGYKGPNGRSYLTLKRMLTDEL